MKKQEIYFKSSKMLELVNDLTLKAKEINMIKPVKEAFKDISATMEVHKGKKEYFFDQRENGLTKAVKEKYDLFFIFEN